MKKQIFYIFAVVILAVTLCLGTFAVEVGTADELVAIMLNPARWSEDITLTANIDLTGKEQSPIGTYTTPYTGTFDGAGFTVSGLNIANAATVATLAEGEEGVIATTDDLTVGLFGVVQGATIRDLTVKGVFRPQKTDKIAQMQILLSKSITLVRFSSCFCQSDCREKILLAAGQNKITVCSCCCSCCVMVVGFGNDKYRQIRLFSAQFLYQIRSIRLCHLRFQQNGIDFMVQHIMRHTKQICVLIDGAARK